MISFITSPDDLMSEERRMHPSDHMLHFCIFCIGSSFRPFFPYKSIITVNPGNPGNVLYTRPGNNRQIREKTRITVIAGN